MKSVIAGTVMLYVVANLPLLYSLMWVHGRSGIAALWGYSPNQFFFLVVIFPFAALYTLLALRLLVVEVREKIVPESVARLLLENWSALLAGCLCLGSLMTLLIYFSAPMSLDKLQPKFADLALASMARIDGLAADSEKPEEYRATLISSAREEAERVHVQYGTNFSEQLKDIAEAKPAVYLYLMQKPEFQLKINILHPVVHALNVAQLCAALFVAAVLVLSVALMAGVAGLGGLVESDPSELGRSASALRVALACFAIYPITYYIQREQLQDYVDIRGVALQHVISGALVLGVLFWLNSLAPSSGFFSPLTLVRYIPFAILGSGYGVSLFAPDVLRQLIGKESQFGWQLIVAVLVAMFGLLPLVPTILDRR